MSNEGAVGAGGANGAGQRRFDLGSLAHGCVVGRTRDGTTVCLPLPGMHDAETGAGAQIPFSPPDEQIAMFAMIASHAQAAITAHAVRGVLVSAAAAQRVVQVAAPAGGVLRAFRGGK